ncbi:MAG: crossover junction endodeoxyribonuclease RuvC [Patescibacteria group bacterium]
MIILGLDPGSVAIGYGLLKKEKKELKLLKSGLFKISSKDKSERLLEIEKSFLQLIKNNKIDIIAIEKLFFMKNMKTALEVAQSRGVLTLVAAKHKISLLEFSPSEVKSAVTGYGLADKKAVAKMVAKFLKIDTIKKSDDETDAIAIALTAANNSINIKI